MIKDFGEVDYDNWVSEETVNRNVIIAACLDLKDGDLILGHRIEIKSDGEIIYHWLGENATQT